MHLSLSERKLHLCGSRIWSWVQLYRLRAINWSVKRVECRGEYLERKNTYQIFWIFSLFFEQECCTFFSLFLKPLLRKSSSKKNSLQADCDSTIQIPSQPVSLTDCFMPCSGNNNETCGGSNRLNVFLNGAVPPPVILQSVNGTQGGLWSFQGCYTSVFFFLSSRCQIELIYDLHWLVLKSLIYLQWWIIYENFE